MIKALLPVQTAIIIYNLILLAGTMFVVVTYDKSLWLFVITYLFMMRVTDSKTNIDA